MAEEGTQYIDTNLYNAARWETNIPNGVAGNELYLYLTHGDRNNALHIAAQHGNLGFIDKALAQADPNHHYRLLCQENSRGETPLHLAAEFGCMAAVEALLHAHENAPAASQPFVHQSKPCWRKGDMKGDTPFHKAIRNRHEDIAISLLGKDINQLVSVDNESGESPAYLAAEGSCLRVLQEILNANNDQRRVSFSVPFGQAIFHSARRCNREVLSRLIDMGGDLFKNQDGEGKTVLHYAVEENRLAAVETLLNADCFYGYLQDNNGFTPLLVASRNGLFPMVMTILKLCPQSVEFRDNQGKTFLHFAKIGDDFLGHLLQNMISKKFINKVDNEGNTPLHTALINSKYQAACDLLAVDGCNWRLKNNEGYSPFDLCKANDTISYQEPVYSALRDLEGGQCVHHSPGRAEQGTQDMDMNLYNAARWETNIPNGVTANQVYLSRTHGDRNNALHIAAQHGNPEFINKALAQADPEHRDGLLCQENSRGETPLHLAAEFGREAAVKALLLAHVRAVPVAVVPDQSWKPCWSEKDRKGDTPLHRALRNGHDDIAMSLLSRDRTLVSVCNKAGESPAYLAAESSCNRVLEEIIVKINQQHPDKISGPFGHTVFHAARSCNENIMNSLIRKNGALLKEKYRKGTTILHYLVEKNRLTTVETLLGDDSSLGYLQDNNGRTPLLVASSNGLFPMITTILKLCPQSVEIHDNQGKTVLHVANPGDGFVQKCLKNKTIKELINQVDNDGNTPLHTTLLKSEYRVAFELLSVHGCNWRLMNNKGYSPLDLCKSNDTIPFKEPVYSTLRDLEAGGQWQVIFQFDVMEEEEVEKLLNKISIAAGLVMSITFQMALNVPGGFDNTTGFPTLHNNPIFTIANCANSVAFLSATFILLWRTFETTYNKKVMAMGSHLLINLALCCTLVTYVFSLGAMRLSQVFELTDVYLVTLVMLFYCIILRPEFIFRHLV